MRESRRLWPDPFLAPDVPPRETLERYLSHPQEFDPGFALQLRSSVEAQRALDHLRRGVAARTPVVADAAGMDLLKAIARRAGNIDWRPSAAARPVLDEVDDPITPEACAPGEIWMSKDEVEHRDGTRRVFDVPDFLVVAGPERRGGDTVVHAVPVTNADLWPNAWRTPDDVPVSVPGMGDYVAHLDLPVRVSLSQLRDRLGSVRDADRQRVLAVRPGKGKARPALPPEAGSDREQLRARTRWLEATAEARAGSVPVPGWARRLWERTRASAQGVRISLGEWWRERLAVIAAPQPAYALGAHASGAARKLTTRRFRADSARLLITECIGDANTFALAVLADPDRILEGARIVDSREHVLASVRDGRAESTFTPEGGGFLILLVDGNLAQLEDETVA